MYIKVLHKAQDEKSRNMFVGQQIGVTSKHWFTPKGWIFLGIFFNFYYFQPFFYVRLFCAFSKMLIFIQISKFSKSNLL